MPIKNDSNSDNNHKDEEYIPDHGSSTSSNIIIKNISKTKQSSMKR